VFAFEFRGFRENLKEQSGLFHRTRLSQVEPQCYLCLLNNRFVNVSTSAYSV
jgi:hypothetical protein